MRKVLHERSFDVCQQVRLGKWDDALEMLGEVNPFRGKANEPRELFLKSFA